MKKNYVLIIVLSIVLAGLVAGNRIISSISEKNAAKKEAEAELESEKNTIHVNSLKDCESIEFNDLKFNKSSDVWTYEKDEKFPLDTEIVETIANEFINLTSSRKLVNGDTLESYGLTEPAYEIILTDSNGTTESFKLGNTYGNEYYVMVNDDDSVIYLCSISSISYLDADILKFVTKDTTPDWSNTVTEIEISDTDNTTVLSKSESDSDIWMVKRNSNEEYEATDTDTISSTLTALKITYSDCIGYNVKEEDYSDYGFDTPFFTIKIKYLDENSEECELNYTIGGYNSASSTYSIISNLSDQAYTISLDNYNSIIETLTYDFLADEEE